MAAIGQGSIAAAIITACGGDGGSTGSSTSSSSGGASAPAGSAGAAQAGSPRAGGTFRVPTAVPLANLDIHKTNAGSVYWDWVGNYLVRFDIKQAAQGNVGMVEPDLAAAMPELPDTSTFVFKLNPQAKWQQRSPVNGRTIHSEDVKYSFEDVMDPKTASPRAGNYATVDKIETPDPLTVVFRMKAPKPDLLPTMADQYDLIYPREWATNKPALATNAAEVVGTGPYELVSFTQDKGWRLERRKDGYWKPNTAWLDAAEYTVLPDAEAQVAGLLSGQFDFIAGQSVLVDKKSDLERAGISVYQTLNASRASVNVNHNLAPFSDPRVRLALSRVVNRKQAFDLAFAGAGKAGTVISPSLSSWMLPEAELSKLPGYLSDHSTDIKEAKQLMEAAGVKEGYEVTYDTLVGAILEMDTVLVPMFRQIGLNVKLRDVGPGGALAILQRYAAPDFQMGGFSGTSGPYPDVQLILFNYSDRKLGTRNYSNFSNSRADELMLKQSQTFDVNERRTMIYEIQRIMAMEPGPVWIGSTATLWAYSKAVQGYNPVNATSGFQIPDNVWLKN
jgi:peptide/nickel transport system substrate-binding protein